MKGVDNTYNPKDFEDKVTKHWVKSGVYKTPNVDTSKQKFYSLYSYPYPSGAGLHVGHVEGMVANDISARYNRMLGKNVLMPMGWDSFGLPAENYAIKTGIHPKQTTDTAIKTFIDQINKIGISVDWDTEVAAHDPNYYKWTQWIFIKLYEKGLAYKKQAPANWCPSCQTVLANEQVIDGKCERCDTLVTQKSMDQWFFKITDYKDRLIDDLKKVDWPQSTKQQQINWVGRSFGAEIKFDIPKLSTELKVFTTRPDTIYGATFMVIAPEHPLVKVILNQTNLDQSKREEITNYIKSTSNETDIQRQTNKDKTGVNTNVLAVNPATKTEIPIYISDYVLMQYGTGAIMAVPAHDERDYQFAQKFNIPILQVVSGDSKLPFIGEGKCINSGNLNGLTTKKAKEQIVTTLEKDGYAKKQTTYKLRDWLLSRQRYWGCPIPVVYDSSGKPHAVKEQHLPWLLPEDVDFVPKGYSPLSRSKELKERVEKLYGKGWTPEYDTMDTFVDSSWYFFRHVDAKNNDKFADSKKLNYWLPTDLYMIGAEHIVLHLFYARFFTKFLCDEGYINFDEPFYKMRHMGLVLGPDGRKMSKRWGNVINPSDVVASYGGDTVRVYEMFMGPIETEKPWNESSIAGVYRFLSRVYELYQKDFTNNTNPTLETKLHKCIQKVTLDIPELKFNTSIAYMMEFVNLWSQIDIKNNNADVLSKKDAYMFLQVLAPFAPFVTEHINNTVYKNNDSIHLSSWPQFDNNMLVEKFVTIPVQINGKLRAEINVETDKLQLRDDIIQQAKSSVKQHLESVVVKKEIYVPGKIVNFVV